jgi:hypothetical protein
VVWTSVAVGLHLLVAASRRSIDPGPRSLGLPSSWASWARGWVNFDGWDYVHLAQHGYQADPGRPTRAVWFPLYPLAIRASSVASAPLPVLAVAVAAVGGLLALVLFSRWMRSHGLTGAAATTGLLVAALYPYGWFLYGGAYSNSLLVAAALGTFLAYERGHRALAGAIGALAVASHPTGLAVVVGLVALEAERRGALTLLAPGEGRVLRVGRHQLRWPVRGDAGRVRLISPLALAPLAGLAAYSIYLWATLGHPLLWWSGRAAYQGNTLHDLSKVDFVSRWITGTDRLRAGTTLVQAAILVGVVVLIPAVARRFGIGYGAYVAAVAAMPIAMTADFNGSGRYLLAAFPCAAVAGERLAGAARARWAYLAASGGLLATLTVGFGHSLYLT